MSEKIYEPKTEEEKKSFGRGGEKIYEPKTKKEKKDLAKKNLSKPATKPKLDSTPEDKPTLSRMDKELMKQFERAEKENLKKRNERGEGPKALEDILKNYKRKMLPMTAGEPLKLKNGGHVGIGIAKRGFGKALRKK